MTEPSPCPAPSLAPAHAHDVTVILAAGAGSRLGGEGKALLRLGGDSLAGRALRSSRAAGTLPLLVLGYRADAVRTALTQEGHGSGMEFVDCPDWEQGLSASFRAGVRAAADLGAGRVAVVLVDQPPGIGATALQTVLHAQAPGRIARGAVGGSPTHPVVFDLPAAQAAAELAVGDEGARTYLREHPELVDAIDISRLAEVADIDTPADLDSWTRGRPSS